MKGLLLLNFIVPFVMLLLGNTFKRNPVAQIGSNGYSTKRSRASKEAWDFAQNTAPEMINTAGKIVLLLELIVSVILAMLPVLPEGAYVIGQIIGVGGLIVFFYRMEDLLKCKFGDKDKKQN